MPRSDDEPRADPLDLGTVTRDTDGAHTEVALVQRASTSHARGRRRRFATLGTALVCGIVSGVLINGAVGEADGADAELIAIASFPLEGPHPPDVMTVDLYNAGDEDVDVLDVDVVGYQHDDETPDGEVDAPAGTWTTVELSAEPACDVEPSGGVEVRVRDSGTATTETDPGDISGLWNNVCGDIPVEDLRLGLPETTLLDDRLRTTVPVANGFDNDFVVSALSSTTPGLTAETSLPVTVPVDRDAELEIVWTVHDCAAAEGLTEPEIEYEYEDRRGERSRLVMHSFGGATLVELARLTERVCET